MSIIHYLKWHPYSCIVKFSLNRIHHICPQIETRKWRCLCELVYRPLNKYIDSVFMNDFLQTVSHVNETDCATMWQDCPFSGTVSSEFAWVDFIHLVCPHQFFFNLWFLGLNCFLFMTNSFFFLNWWMLRLNSNWVKVIILHFYSLYIYIYISKFGNHNRGWHGCSLFNSYYTKMFETALLLSMDCATLPLIHTL